MSSSRAPAAPGGSQPPFVDRRKPLRGQTAIIFGCARERGFGRAAAERLGALGARLVLVDRKGAFEHGGWQGVSSLSRSLEEAGFEHIVCHADVRSQDEVRGVFEEAVKAFETVDIVYYGVASSPGADRVPIAELQLDSWDEVMETNLRGAFIVVKHAAKQMISQHREGRIIVVSSSLGKVAKANYGAYCTSKFALIGLTGTLALELAPHRITVNSICPILSDTGRADFMGIVDDSKQRDEELFRRRIGERTREVPLGRLLDASEVASLVGYLALPEASFITGQAINLSGGLVMH